MRPYAFPVDPKGGIDAVKLKMLPPYADRRPGRRDHFGVHVQGPLSDLGVRCALRRCRSSSRRLCLHPGRACGQLPSEGRFVEGQHPDLKITMPNGCDLKDQTPEQEMIAAKYQRRWGLLEEA